MTYTILSYIYTLYHYYTIMIIITPHFWQLMDHRPSMESIPRLVPVLGDEVSIAPSRVQEVIEGIVLNKMHTWDMSVAYQLRQIIN